MADYSSGIVRGLSECLGKSGYSGKGWYNMYGCAWLMIYGCPGVVRVTLTGLLKVRLSELHMEHSDEP